MKLSFYATRKRINSFIRPEIDGNPTNITDFDATFLKDTDTSMTTPTFYIAASNFPETNYCILQNFQAPDGSGHIYRPPKIYYWITDIISDHVNRWYIKCKKDLLATWKEQILSQVAFIERSASHFNEYLIDTEVPTEVQISGRTAVVGEHQFFNTGQYQGTYLFCCLSRGLAGNVMSAVATTYALTATGVVGLKYRLMLGGNLEMFKQKFADVSSALISMRYSPFSISDLADQSSPYNVVVGDYDTEVPGYPLKTSRMDKFALLDIPKPFGDYRDVTQTSYTLTLPFYGIVPIDSVQLAGATQLSVSFIYDVFSGDYCYVIKAFVNGSLMPIATYGGNADVHLPLGAYHNNLDKAFGHAISMGVAGITTVATAAIGSMPMAVGAGAATVAGAANTVQALNQKTASVVGAYSGNVSQYLGNQVVLSCETMSQSIDPALIASLRGRPCYAVHQLSALSGYCKTRNFRLQNTGYMTYAEQKEVEDMLNYEGVFI